MSDTLGVFATDLEIDGDTTTSMASTMKEGSTLAENSTLGAGWNTDQTLNGNMFSNSTL